VEDIPLRMLVDVLFPTPFIQLLHDLNALLRMIDAEAVFMSLFDNFTVHSFAKIHSVFSDT
jgi:hypothetical protein